MTPDDLPAALRRVVVNEEGCWLRTVRILSTGYSLTGSHRHGTQKMAHRFVYEAMVGPIPDGLVIDHTCHNRSTTCGGGVCEHRRCINPAHLEPVPNRENVNRSPFSLAARTHCPQGHPYDEANTLHSSGRRHCRICSREKSLRWYDEHRRSPHVPVTHCINGHPYNGDNLRIVSTTGARVCRACELARGRAYKARQKELRNGVRPERAAA